MMKALMETAALRAYLVDDEPLAIERLERLLAKAGVLKHRGPAPPIRRKLSMFLNRESIDVLFLDIQMPGMNGFELLSRLRRAALRHLYDRLRQYALRAFEVNSIDYLVKPIEPEQLARALKKLDRLRPAAKPDWQRNPELPALLKELAASLRGAQESYPRRIASRVGERIAFLDLDAVTHFVAHEKLTYAVVNGRQHCVDQTIAELERRLDPAKFLRVHRAALVNVDWIHEVELVVCGQGRAFAQGCPAHADSRGAGSGAGL